MVRDPACEAQEDGMNTTLKKHIARERYIYLWMSQPTRLVFWIGRLKKSKVSKIKILPDGSFKYQTQI